MYKLAATLFCEWLVFIALYIGYIAIATNLTGNFEKISRWPLWLLLVIYTFVIGLTCVSWYHV